MKALKELNPRGSFKCTCTCTCTYIITLCNLATIYEQYNYMYVFKTLYFFQLFAKETFLKQAK